MALQTGERYRCSDPNCGCEIEVTKGANPSCGGNQGPRCCCGKEMEKINNRFMNPFDYFESVSTTIEHYPPLAVLIAAVGGLLSTST